MEEEETYTKEEREHDCCSELPPVDNSVFVAKKVDGQILGVYLCIRGFHLVGKPSLVLNPSEEWNVSLPECRLGHCPEPVLENGKSNYSGPVNANDKIVFECNDGYVLKGSNWSQCLEDHTWAPSVPICRSRDCEPPGIPIHGYFEGGSFTSGSVVTYYCEGGREMTRNTHPTSTGMPTICRTSAMMGLLQLPQIQIMEYFSHDHPRAEHLKETRKPAMYHLLGTQKLQCIDGEWSSSYPICESVQEASRRAEQTALGKAILAFQESEDFCSATENFLRTLKENGLTVEELKYSLEMKKTKLKTDVLMKYHN